ncbi:glucosaminidase domain-containing protein [Planctobacterium marinum]|uniref:Glucosaminidase n=1 Tax=Planctobacterium marinum TaxID=1631968 RepID=A0AA48HN32_9ALTE|nr:glucosaminidase [Planctobacterium marinum]
MHKSLRSRLWIGGVTLIGVVAFLYPFLLPPQPPAEVVTTRLVRAEPIPDFSSFQQVTEKKRAFFSYLLPEIEKQNEIILSQRTFILALQSLWLAKDQKPDALNPAQHERLAELAQEYNVKFPGLSATFFNKLLTKVDIIPKELVLVQAANESAWGTSRFARQGYNFFGMWCYRKGCGFVPRQRDDDMNHEVAKYRSLSQGVAKYLNTLNRHFAYQDLRYIRAVLRKTQQPITAEMLAEGLLHYSERGQAYVEELQAMIRVNRKHMKYAQEQKVENG